MVPQSVIWTKPHNFIHAVRLKQTKMEKPWWLFPFIEPQSCGDVYTLVHSRPLWSRPYPLEVCVHVSVRLQAQLEAVSGPYRQTSASWRWVCLATTSIPYTPSWKTEPQWQLEVSVEHCVCEWHVSLISLWANLIAFHIIFIVQKQSDNYALERYWHCLEMSPVFSHAKQARFRLTCTNKQRWMLAHIWTHVRNSLPLLSRPSCTDTHLQIH